MLLKSLPIAPDAFKVDGDTGQFTGYASVFGNRDHGGDVVMAGAFSRTIGERFGAKLIKVFRNHRDPVGMPLELREDERGLFVHGQLNLDKPIGRETLAELKSGELSHMSFAYDVVRSERGEDSTGRPVMKLLDLELYEVGPVYWPMNEAARIESVKSIREALGTSPVGLTLPNVVSLLRSSVAELEQKGEVTDEQRQQIKDALRDLGPLTRTLSGIPRTREESPAAAPEAPEQKKAPPLDLSSLAAALNQLRSVAAPPGA